MLEAIIQLPNNLFYNTGITTYIWILSNNKSENRKGKVQLIDAGELYKKLRKNLGDKNCELTPKHITQIIEVYQSMKIQDKDDTQKLGSKVFDNSDFGYYKVNIERPKRLKSQLRDDLIETLRYDKSLIEPMRWAYESFGKEVYKDIAKFEKEILAWCEKEEINLKPRQKKSILSQALWDKHQNYTDIANTLKEYIGDKVYDDFNTFKIEVDKIIKQEKIKLSSGEKNQILNAISWYDESAKKVVKKIHKLNKERLNSLLEHLGCSKNELENFGYYKTKKANGKTPQEQGQYIEYEAHTNIRDSENIPLKDDIQNYFLKEVKPHVAEAWINLDSVKIGYEISFNKYFYKHKPLRSIEEVTADIVELEKESEGLIKELLGL
jgi:type I restriction enzyme M protein